MKLFVHYFSGDEVGGEKWNSYLGTMDDHSDGASSHEQENISTEANTTIQEKSDKRRSYLVGRNRSLRSEASVLSVEMASDTNFSQTNVSRLEKKKGVSQHAKINRFLMNKTIASDTDIVQAKSSGTGSDQSRTQLKEETSEENKNLHPLSFTLLYHMMKCYLLKNFPLSSQKIPPQKFNFSMAIIVSLRLILTLRKRSGQLESGGQWF